MGNSIQFNVSGVPSGKARARVFRLKNGGARAVTPEKTVLRENWIRHCFTTVVGSEYKPLDVPVKVECRAIYAMPKSWSGKKRELMHSTPKTSKPDLDNVLKTVLDGLNGVAWRDDSQVAFVSMDKIWGDLDTMHVSITPTEGKILC